MVRKKTSEIEGVGPDGEYQRIYIPAKLSSDSSYPFETGDGVRLQVVETTCNREVLVLTRDTLEVDLAETDLEIQTASDVVQTDLEEVPNP